METTKSYKNGNLVLDLDKSQVFPDDPGNGTPAMVRLIHRGKELARASYWAAVNEEQLRRDDDSMHRITPRQLEWLESLDAELTEFLYKS